jgi:hypothetical protein
MHLCMFEKCYFYLKFLNKVMIYTLQFGSDYSVLCRQCSRKYRKRRQCRHLSEFIERRRRGTERRSTDKFVRQNSRGSRSFFSPHHVHHHFFHAMWICIHGSRSCQVLFWSCLVFSFTFFEDLNCVAS